MCTATTYVCAYKCARVCVGGGGGEGAVFQHSYTYILMYVCTFCIHLWNDGGTEQSRANDKGLCGCIPHF